MKAPDAGIVSWGLKGEAEQRRTAGDTPQRWWSETLARHRKKAGRWAPWPCQICDLIHVYPSLTVAFPL